MTWFESLTGFKEQTPDQVRSMLTVEGNRLTSKANGQTYIYGQLETLSLAELRTLNTGRLKGPQSIQIQEKVGNVQDFHADPANEGAFFQAASQFNLLEMINPEVTPDDGIGIYENDPTQGPACAIAAGAGTIYRNYLVKINGQRGQSAGRQIDCLADVGQLLGNRDERLWRMQNGYALPSRKGLAEVDQKIAAMEEAQKDLLRQQLRIGLQWNTQVTLKNCRHLVTQAYGSALPVAYSGLPASLWERFARLILEASYEATLHAALLNYRNTQNPNVFLTLLGGGAFGNEKEWIFDAIQRALNIFRQTPLKVHFVSYGQSNPAVLQMIKFPGTQP
jgi:hypothetical protein